MHNAGPIIARDIVLVGGGHSHVGVLRRFAMAPEPGVRLTLICSDSHTPYSGMLPGYVAGHYTYDEVHIDLRRLAVRAKVRFLRDTVTGIDRAAGTVLCASRPPVPFDQLSLNIGSTPQLGDIPGAAGHVVPVKPIHQFNQRWLALLERARQHAQGPLRIAVVGAGAGGVELLLSMQYRLRNELKEQGRDPGLLEFHLLSAQGCILPTHNPRVRKRFMQVLAERGVQLHLDAQVTEVGPGRLVCGSDSSLGIDETIWVTQAGGAAWLRSTGLGLDAGGFVRVNDFLQCPGDPRIFAAGDIAAMQNYPLEKAGVFAVRMGRPLADNLRRAVRGEPLQPYRPQRHWLALISTGDRFAVASRGALEFAGAWVWRWKDWIDQRFMRRFSELPVMEAAPGLAPASMSQALRLDIEESQQALSALAMRCGGCGAKVGAGVLDRTLGKLEIVQRDAVLIGLQSPDDAAVVRVPAGRAMVHTVDFFRAFIDDPYLFGKIAANHALGDIFAMGAEAQTATAIATLPPGLDRKVGDLLLQMMTGAVEVLNEAGCALVGGHTGEGSELALGFAVNGLVDDQLDGLMKKGGMRPGDALILTKAIGTGTLFAAHARGLAKGHWIDSALDSMQVSNRRASQCLRTHGATACTDLTGFGLLGHLLEMARPSGVDLRIRLGALPLLDGAESCAQAGIASSLHSANLRLVGALRNGDAYLKNPRYPLLFDPQTAGGLLATVQASQAAACIAALQGAGYDQACRIGEVVPLGDATPSIWLEA